MVAAAVFSLLWAPPVLLGVRGGTVSQFCHVMMVHSLPFICILGASRCSNLLGVSEEVTELCHCSVRLLILHRTSHD